MTLSADVCLSGCCAYRWACLPVDDPRRISAFSTCFYRIPWESAVSVSILRNSRYCTLSLCCREHPFSHLKNVKLLNHFLALLFCVVSLLRLASKHVLRETAVQPRGAVYRSFLWSLQYASVQVEYFHVILLLL